MKQAIITLFALLPFFAAAQAPAQSAPQPTIVDYKEDFTLTPDSTGIVMRVTKVEETKVSDEMQAGYIRSIEEQIKQYQAAIEALEEQKRKILSAAALVTLRKNKKSKK